MSRGQATVELALGALVFVTVLMGGIFFAELGFLAQKVQEATNFAVWDATARPVHDLEGGDWRVLEKQGRKGAVPWAEKAAQRRYRDFDGREDEDRDGATYLSLLRASPIDVACRSGVRDFGVSGTGPRDADSSSVPEGYLRDAMPSADADAGIACQARSRMRSVRIPTRFMDEGEGKLFKRRNWTPTALPICGVGRADGGSCPGRLVVLLDDWGLQTRRDHRECTLNIDSDSPSCGNADGSQSYYNWAKRVYEGFGATGGAGAGLVGAVKGGTIDEGQFFMSFRGAESNFTEDTGSNESGQSRWETNPFRADNIFKRNLRGQDRWLGHAE